MRKFRGRPETPAKRRGGKGRNQIVQQGAEEFATGENGVKRTSPPVARPRGTKLNPGKKASDPEERTHHHLFDNAKTPVGRERGD